MSKKNSEDTIGNGTRDLSACSRMPQVTAPSRTPELGLSNSLLTERLPVSSPVALNKDKVLIK
jgi:hypothetical protein